MNIKLRPPRIGLVLGAGGVLGGAWTAGALNAIVEETGWDPYTASHIVGTSAGSLFAALIAARVEPERLLPDGGEDLTGWLLSEVAAAEAYRPTRLPRPRPGSIGLALRGIRERSGAYVLKALSGLGPEGIVSTEPIERTVRRAVGDGAAWVPHPACWIVACDYHTGERVVFGRPATRRPAISTAVAASCAIPSFFQPVQVGGRSYVDGGLHSMSNADLLAGQGLDLCVVLNPLSARAGSRSWHPVDRVAAGVRRLAAWQIEREVAALRDGGTDVVVLEPTPVDARAIGPNLMDARRALDVAESALASARELIRRPDVAELLSILPRQRQSRGRARRWGSVPRQAARAAAV